MKGPYELVMYDKEGNSFSRIYKDLYDAENYSWEFINDAREHFLDIEEAKKHRG